MICMDMIEDGKGDAASSEEKTGVLELKASEKDQTLCEASNDVKKGDMRFSLCNGRSYANVVATNCGARPPPPRPLPPSRPVPGPATCSEQKTTAQPEEEEEDDDDDEDSDDEETEAVWTVNLYGQRALEGLRFLKRDLIQGAQWKGVVKYLQVIIYPSVPFGSDLRLAIIDFLTMHRYTWTWEEKENFGWFLITFDGRPWKEVEKEEFPCVNKKCNAAARRETKTDVVVWC